jgi:UDP-N-acetylmuramoyl-L-alanyl-D-glutamate--2,6-diaminopimelate ligase
MSALESAIFRRLMRTSVNTVVLSELIDPLHETGSVEHLGPDVRVTGLCTDSRRAAPGDLFFAADGHRDDGLRYAEGAVERGAVGVVASRRVTLPPGAALVRVDDVVAAKARLADRFFGRPSQRLDVVGITGTNGKTTTSFMLRSMLTMDGRDAGLVGTLGAYLGQRHEPLANTTPDAVDLQRLMARMVDENYAAAIMEVSSHALVQRRVAEIAFDVGVFTNLTPDHLDYHGSMDAYGAAKGRLFEMLSEDGTAVLNAADPQSRIYRMQTKARVLQFALNAPADVRGDILRLDADGSVFGVHAPEFGLDLRVTSRLVGRHNVENALAATTAALALGLPPHAIATGLQGLTAVPGRLEPVDCGQDFRVLVDYAHTPDALEKVLDLLRPLTRGRLTVVFGCGGDRDRSKRPLMARAVAAAADRLIVTSDNPRSEDPEAILDEVFTGLTPADRARTVREPDRREAIRRACAAARGGDIVLIAGKGHETVQILGERTLPFDDRQVAREVLWNL